MTSLFFSIALSFLPGIHNAKFITDTPNRNTAIPITYAFNRITIYNDIRVYIAEGDKNEILVNNEEAASNIKFKVNDDVLVIKSKKNMFSGNSMIKIIIVVKDIKCITIMGDAEVRTIGLLSDQNLKLEIFGDGAIYASTKASEVVTFIKGVGKIEVKGNFKTASVNKDAYGNMVTIYN
jgi:Putative auto-transporter adhesin, head GIN domain